MRNPPEPSPTQVADRDLRDLKKRYADLRDRPTKGMTLDEYLDHQRRLNEVGWKLKARTQKQRKDVGNTDNISPVQ